MEVFLCLVISISFIIFTDIATQLYLTLSKKIGYAGN